MAGFVVPSVFTAIDKLTAPVRKMQSGVVGFARRSEAVVHRVDRAFIKVGRTIGAVAGQFGLFLGASALFVILQSGISTIADYQQANANLASVLGVNIEQTANLQKNSRQLGATTSFTASQVAALQTEYAKLGFVESEILKVTRSTLALAAATNTELPQAAKQVGASVRAFGLNASEAGRISDVFASSISKSGLDMEMLNVSMSKVAPVAKQFGFSIENTVALMGKLADAGFDASTMATSTRSIILNLADSNGKLAKALGGPARNINEVTGAMIKMREKGIDLAKMLELTDKRSVAAFGTFLEQAEGIQNLNNKLETAGGTAQNMADKQLNTLKGSFDILKSAYNELILSVDDGNGTFTSTIRQVMHVTSEILLLASGMAVAKSELTGMKLANRELAETVIKVLKVTKWMVLGYVALKTIIFITRTAYAVYSIGLGIATALQWKNVIAVKGNVIAMNAARIATIALTFATKAWGVVMAVASGPIGWIIGGIVLLGAAIYGIIKYWDDWGAAVTLFLGPLGMVISLIQSFRMHWESVVKAFKTGGIVSGLKAIALVIADSVLKPIEQLLQLINRFTGIDLGLGTIQGFRGSIAEGLGESPQLAGPVSPVNADATRTRVETERFENYEQKNIKLTLDDPSGKLKVDEKATTPGFELVIDSSFKFD